MALVIPIKDNLATDRFAFVTFALIVVNVVAYVFACSHGGSLISGPDGYTLAKYGVTAHRLTHFGQPGGLPVWETAFTTMFMHASIVQLAGNVLFLWIFGNTLEASMGRASFAGFYLAGGLVALALQVATDPNSTAPTVGAAGAIGAVLGGYVVLYPRAGVLTLVLIPLCFTVIELPVVVMLALWFVEQAVFGATSLTDPAGGGEAVAYLAHVGSLVFGAATLRLLATRHKLAA